MNIRSQYKANILVVDDEEDIRDFLKIYLTNHQYLVQTVQNGLEAYQVLKKKKYDLLILDYMMPQVNGLEFLKTIRNESTLKDVAVIMLTAHGVEANELKAFEFGVDDFINKPIKPLILKSRIEALLRNKNSNVFNHLPNIIKHKHLEINKELYLVTIGNTKTELPKKEFELLYLLLSKPGKVFKREDILDIVWGNDVLIGDRTIDVHIRKLREKIGDEIIKTVKGVGYKLD